MHIRPQTGREKLWLLIIVVAFATGLSSSGGLLYHTGRAVGLAAVYMIPLLIAPRLYSVLGRSKQEAA